MATAIKEIYWLLVTAVAVIVGLGGGIFSAYNFWDAQTNDRPEEKKKGITTLIVTVVSLILIIAIATIMWNVLQGYVTDLPNTIPTT